MPVILLLGLGAAVRALRFVARFRPPYHWDEAATGLWAIQVLSGALPVNFLGNEYQGAPGAYPLAVWFWLVGSSTHALDAFAYGVGLLGLWTGWLVARRLLRPGAALAALLLLAVPPLPLAARSLSGGLGYPALLVLGNVFLLATHSVFHRAPPRRRALLGAGIVAGLGWWGSPLFVVYLAPFAWLALRHGLAWRRPVGWLVLGGLLGSLPCWVYEVVYFPSARFTVQAGGDAAADPFVQRAITILGSHVPSALGFAGRSAPGVWTVGLGASLALALLGLGLAFRRDRAASGAAPGPGGAPGVRGAILLGVAVANFAVVLASPQGAAGGDRYFHPLHSVLPCWGGLALAWIWRGSRLGAVVAGGTLVALHAWMNWAAGPGGAPPEKWRWTPVKQRLEPVVAWLESRGARHAYWALRGLPPGYEMTYLAAGRVVFADLWRETVLAHARAVDASVAPPLVTRQTEPEANELRRGLAALGLEVRESRVGDFVVFETGGAAARRGFLALPPDGWRVSAEPHPELAGALVDRDAATGWTSGRGQRPGQALVLDLGRETAVARVDLLAVDWQELPDGFRVEVSPDGARWETVVSVPRYWGPLFLSEGHPVLKVRRGRVQAIFAPTPARWLRVVQTGAVDHPPWAAREIFVYAPGPARADGEPPLEPLFRDGAPGFVYTGARLAARVRTELGGRIGAPEFNYLVNDNGRSRPDPRWLEPLRIEPGLGLLLGRDADWAAVEAVLAARGVPVRSRTAGPYRLLAFSAAEPTPRRLDRTGWRATASVASRQAGRAVDGNPRTAWTADRPVGPADHLTIDLGRVSRVSGVRWTPGSEVAGPRAFELEGSQDGETWTRLAPARWTGALHWTGSELLRNSLPGWQFAVPATSLRHLRIRPTAGSRGPWRVGEVECFE